MIINLKELIVQEINFLNLILKIYYKKKIVLLLLIKANKMIYKKQRVYLFLEK